MSGHNLYCGACVGITGGFQYLICQVTTKIYIPRKQRGGAVSIPYMSGHNSRSREKEGQGRKSFNTLYVRSQLNGVQLDIKFINVSIPYMSGHNQNLKVCFGKTKKVSIPYMSGHNYYKQQQNDHSSVFQYLICQVITIRFLGTYLTCLRFNTLYVRS